MHGEADQRPSQVKSQRCVTDVMLGQPSKATLPVACNSDDDRACLACDGAAFECLRHDAHWWSCRDRPYDDN